MRNNRGMKRKRTDSRFQDLNPHEEEGPCLKRLNGESGLDKLQFNDDSFETGDPFDLLGDDVMISILRKFSATATTPAHLINILLVSKRFSVLGLDPEVLKMASAKSIWVKAENWSESAHHFLARCANSGNLEACYFLGMIRFYCLSNHASGVELLKKAAQGSHAGALYSLAILDFNGSGSTEGGLRRKSNTDEPSYSLEHQRLLKDDSLLKKHGFYENIVKEVHAANMFMVEWWSLPGWALEGITI